jgi:hypothetical protein
MRPGCVVVCAPVADRRFFIKRNLQMSSSNLAVRTDDTATDLLSLPPRSSVGVVNSDRPARNARRRTSLTNRKFISRDHGLKLFRVR